MTVHVFLLLICSIESPGHLRTGETFFIVSLSHEFGQAAEAWSGTHFAEVVVDGLRTGVGDGLFTELKTGFAPDISDPIDTDRYKFSVKQVGPIYVLPTKLLRGGQAAS